jgi:hypothetical protein
MSLLDVGRLRGIAEVEFADIVAEVIAADVNELRVILMDGSFVDVWFSLKLAGRYSFHWERRAIDGKIYRHDNVPHSSPWRPSRAIFTTAAKAMYRKVTSVRFLKMRSGSSLCLCVTGQALYRRANLGDRRKLQTVQA